MDEKDARAKMLAFLAGDAKALAETKAMIMAAVQRVKEEKENDQSTGEPG